MAGSILGTSVRRVEDPNLLLGQSTYVDSIKVEGELQLIFVRSPFAHANIRGIQTDDAKKAPGVVGVYTAADLGLPPHHAFMALNDLAKRPPLADGKVRFVGDAVVAIVAETRAQALDASELVVVDYEPLDVVVDPEEALSAGAPLQFAGIPNNVAAGFKDSAGASVLDGADRVVRARFVNQRVAVASMEGNAILSIPPNVSPDQKLTIFVSTQMPHGFAMLIGKILGIDRSEMRVVAPNVGGAFGGKAGLTAEHTVAVATSRLLGKPVKWVETRSENMVAMPHGRGQVQYVELGVKNDGTIVGLRARMVGDAGAYAGFGGALALGPTRNMAQGVYEIPKISYDAVAALTNTTPMGAFRGAGRPEATAFLERLIDIAADELGIDPAQMRRINLISPDQFPYLTRMGTNYDVGDYASTLEKALEEANYNSLRIEQARRIADGETRLLGIGISSYVEVTAGGSGSEFGAVRINADGSATVRVGTSGHGQGHATSFSMIVSDRLGIPVEQISFVQSDTDEVPRGSGTGGSRSLQIGGSAISGAADAVLAKAKEVAAQKLEASVDDIVVSDFGGLQVAGVPDSRVNWVELVSEASEMGLALDEEFDFTQAAASFPFGSHVSVVEVDVETGEVRPIRHVAVDDCGRILNPLIVQGQQHGGIAQGIAQVLWEEIRYDEEGNPLTANFADYGIPSAAELCSFETFNTETPTPLNPLGAKGIGESGTIGAMPAVQNAVVDALSHLGVLHIDMPCTPERVWSAIANPIATRELWKEPPPIFDQLPMRGVQPASPASEVDV